MRLTLEEIAKLIDGTIQGESSKTINAINSLDNADLRNSNLTGSSFYKASLKNVDFSYADLRHVQLYEADLENAIFEGVNLAFSNLCDYSEDHMDMLHDFGVEAFSGVDLSYANFDKADLRNEKTNMVQNEVKEKVEEFDNKSTDDTDDNIMLSISEIDMLRQQLSSCWNAPTGAVIERGDKVTISAKVLQNMKVSANSIRIVDTNIAKTNPFYGPITDSAMRTLLNPECTPLKLPKDKYNLWKNLTITFDYSIMKGY